MASILRDSYRASLLYDGVLVFAQAIKNIYENKDIVIPDVDCRDSEASYEQGREISMDRERERDECMYKGRARVTITKTRQWKDHEDEDDVSNRHEKLRIRHRA